MCIINRNIIKAPWLFLNYLHSFERKTNLNLMKKYVKIKIFVKLSCHLKRIMY